MHWLQRTWTPVLLFALTVLVVAGVVRSTDRPEAEKEVRQPLSLVVDVDARRLEVYEYGQRTRTYRVAVGAPKHPTPRGSYQLSRAIWNPWWHPPDRPWARGAKPTPPGPSNPMGRVKLYFRNLYFIHGTPNTSSIGSAASHGCIRMRNRDVIELARLVHQYGSPDVSPGDIDWLVANSRATRTLWIARPVPLKIV